jgi:CheY-like chemotaxis protein
MVKILVIEDESSILENIADYLEMCEYEVYKATNGRDGIALAENVNPDLIICDIMMPEMDGLEVIKQVRANEMTAEIPFIFLTARSEEDDLRLGMNLGADDYLKKPFKNSDLIASIKTRLNKSSIIKEKSEKKLDDIRYSLTVSLPHELYTPLNGIMGYAQILKNDMASFSPVELDEILEHLYSSAQRLNKIITNYVYYLSLLEIINSGISLDREFTLNAAEIISEHARAAVRKYDRTGDLELQLQAEGIKIAGIHFFKIINELVDNACKFSYDNTKITVKSYTKDDYYYVSIHNYGIGMNQEEIKNIGAYVQFNRAKYEQQGLGLGLAVCKKICEIYSIDIDFYSLQNNYFEVVLKAQVID